MYSYVQSENKSPTIRQREGGGESALQMNNELNNTYTSSIYIRVCVCVHVSRNGWGEVDTFSLIPDTASGGVAYTRII